MSKRTTPVVANPPTAAPPISSAVTDAEPSATPTQPAVSSEAALSQSDAKAQPKTAKKPSGSGKKVIQDPIAREALALAGVDPYAEAYWFDALDNSALSQSERQDLVDDLNEEGLADPKHPTVDDLPLLLARVELLEDAAATYGDRYEFQEPYDDLAQLIRIALGSPEIVH
jgi:hypothetical protein